MASNIKKIVLTGGPCAGKTTALVRIVDHFSALGYKVFTVPEVPTLVTQGGWTYLTTNPTFYYEGERMILDMQLKLEDWFVHLAETIEDQPCVVVCDRGVFDISTYISPEMWQELITRAGYTPQEIYARYDAVLHLVSAADGAEQFYTTANNAQRYEKADEAGLRLARELDKKVIRAWEGHTHFRVINNGEDFERKMQRVLREIGEVLGLPNVIQEERKYLVRLTGEVEGAICSEISQTYLTAEPGCEVRIRRRSWDNGHQINLHTTHRRVSATEEVYVERPIENALYESLLQQADPYRHTINKSRQCFIYQGQFFELDTYHGALEGLVMLETKGIACHQEVKFPPFIELLEDITGRTEYYNYVLSLK